LTQLYVTRTFESNLECRTLVIYQLRDFLSKSNLICRQQPKLIVKLKSIYQLREMSHLQP
jgi:hypothetical protein